MYVSTLVCIHSVSDHLAYGKLSDSEQRHKCPGENNPGSISPTEQPLGQFLPENNSRVSFPREQLPVYCTTQIHNNGFSNAKQMKIFKSLQRLACNPWRRNISCGVKLNCERRHKIKGWSYVNQATIENFAAKVRIFDAAF